MHVVLLIFNLLEHCLNVTPLKCKSEIHTYVQYAQEYTYIYVYYTGRWKRKLLIWLCLLVHLCEFITICMSAFNGNLGLILFAICMHTRTNTHTKMCVVITIFTIFRLLCLTATNVKMSDS